MAHSSDQTSPFNFSPRLVVGLGLVVFGGLLLLGGLDILDTDAVMRLWPLIFVAVGLQQFFNARVAPSGERVFPVNGVIWMAIGGILLLNSTGILRTNIWELFWPAILIAIGVRLMTRTGRPRVRRRMRHRRFDEPAGSAPDAGATADSADSAESADSGSIFAVLSAVKRVSAAVPFDGTEVTAFMGGAHIDLRRAIVPPGGEAVLDLFVVIGGCELVVPPHWVVSAPLVAVMGGVDDKRIVPAPSVIEDATSRSAAPPRLVIRGFVMMGGITIRS